MAMNGIVYPSSASLNDIPKLLQSWKDATDFQHLYEQLCRIYDITEEDSGSLSLCTEMEEKMMETLGTSDRSVLTVVVKQPLLMIHNIWTDEGMVYNPLRSRRPGVAQDRDKEHQLVEQISEKTLQDCHFCNFKTCTASDVFGRLETEHCFTAANAFKFEAWHSMVLLRSHHPTKWSAVAMIDLFTLGMKWFDRVSSYAPNHKFPTIYWDTLPPAGGSQVHQHVHVCVGQHRFPGQLEAWRSAAKRYHDSFPEAHYFSDLVSVHCSLGLTVKHGNACALAHLTPKKDYEVVVICDTPNQHFFELIYCVSRVYIDDLALSSFSMAAALPYLVQKDDTSGVSRDDDMPAVARMVPRASLAAQRSDICSLELFTASSILADPYEVCNKIQKNLDRYLSQQTD